MKTFTITESKAQLSALVEQVVTTGEPVIIGRAGKPMVQLSPFSEPKPRRRIGALQGKISLSKDFNQWDPEEARALGLKD